MDPAVLFFFNDHPGALPLYEALEQRVLDELEGVQIKVQKTQITFANRRNFAFVSFLPARRAADRPDPYLTITFGLPYRLASPQIDGATEPYPNRWTHHVVIGAQSEIDGELMGWIREAYLFSAGKR